MKVDIAHVSGIEKRMTVVIPPEAVTSQIDKAYLDLKKNVRLKGFRPGKAPIPILERYFKAQVEEDVISKIVQETYPKALEEVKAAPVSQPKIENGVLAKDTEFSYTAVFEIKPEITAQGYEGIALDREQAAAVDDSEVAKELENLQNTYATLKDVSGRGIQKGDYVVLDMDGTIGGAAFQGSKQKDFFIEASDSSYIPGFADQISGLAQGQVKTFGLAVPADFARKEMAGKTVDFTVTVKSIKEKVLPGLDDEFAKDLGDYAGIDDLRKKLREEMLERKKRQAETAVREKIFDALIQKNPFDVPHALVEMQARNMIMETQQMLAAQGMNLENLGQSPAQLFERYRAPAERQVRSALILDAIAQKEGLQVEEDDFDKEYHMVSQQVHQDLETVKAKVDREMLRPQILEKKALDFIMAKAKITEK
jgi:trigger factor